MKIYSKYKDYYDYCNVSFGEDPLVIYDRDCEYVFNMPSNKDNLNLVDSTLNRFFICGKIIDVVLDANEEKILIGKDIIDLLNKQKNLIKVRRYYYNFSKYSDQVVELAMSCQKNSTPQKFEFVLTKPTNIDEYKKIFINQFARAKDRPKEFSMYRDWNDIKDCPVVIVNSQGAFRNPTLKDWGIPRVIPAEEIYQMITNWILERQDKTIVDQRTDIEKLLSHGFDNKTSFRH